MRSHRSSRFHGPFYCLWIASTLLVLSGCQEEVPTTESPATSTKLPTTDRETGSATQTPDPTTGNSSDANTAQEGKGTEAISPVVARQTLTRMGATFNDETDGLLVDFGLIRGPVLPENLRYFSAIPSVVSVRFPEGLTDEGLVHVEGMTTLKMIAILGNHVTDAGLKHLSGLSSAERIIIRSNKVASGGIDQLKQALPNCKIDWKPGS